MIGCRFGIWRAQAMRSIVEHDEPEDAPISRPYEGSYRLDGL